MIAAIAVFAMVFAAGAFLVSASDVDGASSEIKGDTNVVKTGGSLTYQIVFYEEDEFETLHITYKAVLNNSAGTAQSGAVSPSSGTLENGVEADLNIKAPSEAGKYTLVVTFIETKDKADPVSTERTRTVTVVKPVTLTATLENNSNVDFTDFAVYFKVDGKLMDDSRQLVSITSKGGTATVKYEWVSETISGGKHTFVVVAGAENIGDFKDIILGDEGTFWVGHSDYGLFNILLGVLLIVIILGLIYFYRKPVKNYGKPKARR
jgi:uncharacterized protein YpmB